MPTPTTAGQPGPAATSGRAGRGPIAALLLVPVGLAGLPLLVAALVVLGTTGALAALGTDGRTATGGGAGCAGAGAGQQVDGVGLDADQMGNAATIVEVTARTGLSARAAVIAVATALTESTLRNLPGGDLDSVGLFQQRVGDYGRATAADPVRATTAFLAALVAVPGWARLPLTVAAQDVQRSARPDAYAGWQRVATGLVARLWPTARPGIASDAAPAAVCPGGAAAPGVRWLPAAGGGVPAGPAVTGSAAARTAVAFALAQLGKPYRWGAAGPDAYDCSGLTMAAWAAAGIALPHWTGDQVHAGTPEPGDLSAAGPGDLVFIPGSDGTSAVPGHVGMVVGWVTRSDGRHLLLIDAPSTGRPVQLADAAGWAAQIVDVRHIA